MPIRTVSEANRRDHWTAKARRARTQRMAAKALARSFGAVEMPCTVTLVRVSPRELDDDNLRGALKATRDGIADYLGIDDRDPRVGWGYGQAKGKPKQYAVKVEVSR
jgi:hypothetical protein